MEICGEIENSKAIVCLLMDLNHTRILHFFFYEQLNDKGKLSSLVVAICLQPKCKWKQQMARDGSASNVKRHLWTTHSDLLTTAEREENPKSGQSTLDSSFSMVSSDLCVLFVVFLKLPSLSLYRLDPNASPTTTSNASSPTM
jgi:hypothetical protein